MKIKLFCSKEITFTEKEMLKTLKMPEDSQREDIEELLAMREDLLKISCPKALLCRETIEEWGEDYVVAGGVRLDSPLVRKNLEGVKVIYPYGATCGTEAEEWSKQFSDPLEQYWADGMKLLLLGKVRKELTDFVRQEYFPGKHMASMNPGSLKDWPLTQQIPLFQLFGEARKELGIQLTDSCLMLPSKSSSGFFFSCETEYENCQFCPMENCPNRRAKFVGEFC